MRSATDYVPHSAGYESLDDAVEAIQGFCARVGDPYEDVDLEIHDDGAGLRITGYYHHRAD